MKYSGYISCDSGNGPGWRVSLFVSGCQFHCPECHNAEAQDYDFGQEFTSDTMKMILKDLSSPHIKGLTLSGGDPLWQSREDIQNYLLPLVEKTLDLGKNVWTWSGFTWEEIMKTEYINSEWWTCDTLEQARATLISMCDVWVDGLFIDDLKDLRLQYRGSSNQRVIDVRQSIATGNIVQLNILR